MKISPEERLKSSIQTNIELLENGIEDIYEPEVKFNTELKLLHQLRELESLTFLEGAEQNWLDGLNNTEKGAFLDLEMSLYEEMKYDEATDAQAKQLRQELVSQIAEINEIEWYEIVNNEVIIDEAKKTQRENLKAEMQNTLSELQGINASQNDDLQAELAFFLDENNNLYTENILPANNLVAINELLIYRLQSDFSAFTSKI